LAAARTSQGPTLATVAPPEPVAPPLRAAPPLPVVPPLRATVAPPLPGVTVEPPLPGVPVEPPLPGVTVDPPLPGVPVEPPVSELLAPPLPGGTVEPPVSELPVEPPLSELPLEPPLPEPDENDWHETTTAPSDTAIAPSDTAKDIDATERIFFMTTSPGFSGSLELTRVGNTRVPRFEPTHHMWWRHLVFIKSVYE
jgi:hypothetical protein